MQNATDYCKPWNAGLASTTPAVGKRLGRLLDALYDEINPNVVNGPIAQELADFRFSLIEKLKADGWDIKIPGNRYIVKRAK